MRQPAFLARSIRTWRTRLGCVLITASLFGFTFSSEAADGGPPAGLKVGASYVCQPAQGHAFKIKVSEINGLWLKGEIEVITLPGVRAIPSGGTGWINLANIVMVLEEKP